MLGHVPEKKDDLTVGFLKGKKTEEEMKMESRHVCIGLGQTAPKIIDHSDKVMAQRRHGLSQTSHVGFYFAFRNGTRNL